MHTCICLHKFCLHSCLQWLVIPSFFQIKIWFPRALLDCFHNRRPMCTLSKTNIHNTYLFCQNIIYFLDNVLSSKEPYILYSNGWWVFKIKHGENLWGSLPVTTDLSRWMTILEQTHYHKCNVWCWSSRVHV